MYFELILLKFQPINLYS